MLQDYVPVLLHVLAAMWLPLPSPCSPTFSSVARAPARRSKTRLMNAALCRSRARPASVKFYLVAMLFILFDIEIVFMYPWAVAFQTFVAQFGPVIFWSMLSFIVFFSSGIFTRSRKVA